MCGIFAYSGKQHKAGEIILNGLKALEYRGYDSWGVVLKNGSKLVVNKHTGKIGDAQLPEVDSTAGIGHTRWATHGGVTKKNSHPHLDCTKDVVVVHNGIIENFAEIKKDSLKKGHTFVSETDSEVFAHLIEEKLKTKPDLKKVMLESFKEVQGMNALIVYRASTGEFTAIKNGSPLVFGKHHNDFLLASDSSALAPHTKEVYFLNDNELLYFNHETQLFDENLKQKDISYFTLNFDNSATTLGTYPNYMIKEISEQPKILRSIALEQQNIIKEVSRIIKSSFGTYFIGCGTAYYACLAATYLFSKIAHRHTNASTASEFSYSLDFITKKSLVIALSQSGETIDIISAVTAAQQKSADILAITNMLGSTLFRMADEKILLGVGPEKCVLATKSFTAKIAHLYLLAHTLAGTYDDGVEYIKRAASEIEKLLQHKEKIHALAKKIRNSKHMYILGRGVSYPTALESALKIKEVSYIHAEGFAAGELKHGVIALIEKGTPVIIYNPDDETYEDTLSSAHEVKARGAYVIGVSSKPNDIYDEYIEVEDCKDATVIPHVVVAQLLGYYLAIEKGYDTDKPRNLAKSVTVK